ncbi:MAG: enoyl-CoA hydratase/isomerase family protein [Syntrophaceae bacterium]|jgi:enoyl-CoA hydratase/carnithine racemase
MEFHQCAVNDGTARIALARGKVNAINERVVDELTERLNNLSKDPAVKSVVLTGTGKFFTFGFDIPEFLSYPKEDFIRYLTKFTDLYRLIFMYPKPVIASLNGHTIAGGCMLAIACDYRIMVSGKARISLNEINFGSSLFAGSVDLLKMWLGQRPAEVAAYTGAMYSAEEALKLGLVDRVCSEAELEMETEKAARDFSEKDPAAFASIKKLLRSQLADAIKARERQSILEFVDIWYSDRTWKNLQDKVIHS